MAEPLRLLPGTRSIVTLTDSLASVKLIQDELLRAGRFYNDIAKAAGLASQTVGRIASGQTKRPQLETIIRLLGALGWLITAQRRT